MPILVTWAEPASRARAENLAAMLDLTLAKTEGCNSLCPYALHVTEQGLELQFKQGSSTSRISVEFLKGPLGYRRQKGGGKKQDIARAIGLRTYKGPIHVLDATAGLGRDAFVLASLGCIVHCVERSPIIATLLSDGLNRASNHDEIAPIVQTMQVTNGDSKEVLKTLTPENAPEVIYLDPMFPSLPKSALTKIEMRIIRDIVGEDLDAEELLSLALTKAKKRVVVKRLRKSPIGSEGGRMPSLLVEGKTNRYDVYLIGEGRHL